MLTASWKEESACFSYCYKSKELCSIGDCYSPRKTRDQSLEDLIKTMEDHFEPIPIIIAECFQFYKRDQKSRETIAAFVAELRSLATNCKFGAHLMMLYMTTSFVVLIMKRYKRCYYLRRTSP